MVVSLHGFSFDSKRIAEEEKEGGEKGIEEGKE